MSANNAAKETNASGTNLAQEVDFSAVKLRQQSTWASGDFSVVAARILYQAEQLCETAELQAGWRVLDVATGSGNAALAAARRGCDAIGVDYVPALLNDELIELVKRFDRNGSSGAVAIAADYIETVIRRRS